MKILQPATVIAFCLLSFSAFSTTPPLEYGCCKGGNYSVGACKPLNLSEEVCPRIIQDFEERDKTLNEAIRKYHEQEKQKSQNSKEVSK